MDLHLQFSDDDLENDSSPLRSESAVSDYVPKFENAKWYENTHHLDPADESQVNLFFKANKLCVEGRYEDALTAFRPLLDQGVKTGASRRELLDSCARCLLRLGRPAEALPLLERSRPLLVSRDHQLVWSQLAADTHERLGRPELSLPLRQAAVAADEQSPLAWLALADTYRALAAAGQERCGRLRLAALLWARAALAETARAARSFVAEAAARRLDDVDAELRTAPLATDELRERLRLRLCGVGGGAGPVGDGEEVFVDRGSSKFQEKVDGAVQWNVPCEEFERKWLDFI